MTVDHYKTHSEEDHRALDRIWAVLPKYPPPLKDLSEHVTDLLAERDRAVELLKAVRCQWCREEWNYGSCGSFIHHDTRKFLEEIK